VFQFTAAVGGTGKGNFQAALPSATLRVAGTSNVVVTGDVNGDGYPDVLTGWTSGATVSVRLNDKQGGLTPGTDVSLGGSIYALALGDVDGNGTLDLVAADYTNSVVYVRLNNGSGVFSGGSSQSLGTNPYALALGDLDGDGDLDLAQANYGGNTAASVSIALNNGSGVFNAGTVGLTTTGTTGMTGLALGDVNNDGALDVVAATASTAYVRLNSGTGLSYTNGANVSVNAGSKLVLADVDGDSNLDLLAASGNAVSVRLNNGSGTLAGGSNVTTLTSSTFGLSVGDIDGDGDLDLVNGGSVRVNDGQGQFTAPTTLPAEVGTTVENFATALADMDGDLDLDQVVYANNVLSVRLNKQPTVISFTPNQGPVGTTIAINGGDLEGTTAVTFSGTSGNTVTTGFIVNATGTQITGVVVPTGAQTGVVTITTPAGQYASTAFFTVCLPVAIIKPATITLDATGKATLTPDLVNNGSQADCGTATTAQLSVSRNNFTCADLGPINVTLTVTDSKGNIDKATAVVTVSTDASQTTTTWTGNASTAWTDCGNWSYGQVPTATIGAIIPTGRTNYPMLASGTMNVDDVTLADGASLTVNSGAALKVNGNWTNNGATTALNGQVYFTGSADTLAIGGSAPTTFGTLVVDKPSNTAVKLGRNMSITSSLIMTSGTLLTGNNYSVTLSDNASIGETDGSYVIGQVKATRDMSLRGGGNGFGGLGVLLQVDQNSTSVPGMVVATRTTGKVLTGAGTSTSIKRWFRLTPANDQNLNVALTFSYFAHELNGIPVANLQLFSSATPSGGGAPSTSWTAYTTTPVSNSNAVQVTGLTHLSDWTAGNRVNPLPVTLTNFTAQLMGAEAVALTWNTATEANTDRFEVERSIDGVNFTRITTVAAHGNSLTAQGYAYRDVTLPAASLLYYRLRIVDHDNSVVYSPVRTVAPAKRTVLTVSVAPNPVVANTAAQLWVTSPATGAGTLTILNAIGQVVGTQRMALVEGTQQLPLSLQALPAGVYTLRLQVSDRAATTKLIIQ
jgi:hypothetical protein